MFDMMHPWSHVPLFILLYYIKGGLQHLTNDVAAIQNYDLVLQDPDHMALVFSMLNPPSCG